MKEHEVAKLNAERNSRVLRQFEELIKKIRDCDMLSDSQKESFIDKINANNRSVSVFMSLARFDFSDEDFDRYDKWFKSLGDIPGILDSYFCKNLYDRYLDTPPVEFDGDIIITDPCYVIKNDDWHDFLDNHLWVQEDTHDNFDKYFYRGMDFIARDTLYGDWSCTVFDMDSSEAIGSFCADAGLVGVFDLKQVLAYNPGFDYHTERIWTTALIKDFKGTVEFIVEEVKGVYDYDSEYHKKGDPWVDYELKVVGHGINKKTGESINFKSSQTGL